MHHIVWRCNHIRGWHEAYICDLLIDNLELIMNSTLSLWLLTIALKFNFVESKASSLTVTNESFLIPLPALYS